MSGEIAPVGALSADDRPVETEGAVALKAQIQFFEKPGVGYMVQLGLPDNEMVETEPLHVLAWYISQNLGPLIAEAAVAWRAFRPTLARQVEPMIATASATIVGADGKPI